MNKLTDQHHRGARILVLLRRTRANARFWESSRFDRSEAAGDDRLQWVDTRNWRTTGGNRRRWVDHKCASGSCHSRRAVDWSDA